MLVDFWWTNPGGALAVMLWGCSWDKLWEIIVGNDVGLLLGEALWGWVCDAVELIVGEAVGLVVCDAVGRFMGETVGRV